MTRTKKIGIILAGVMAALVMVPVAYFFLYIRIVRNPTGSMANTIIPGERVACNLRVGEIRRGDIVVFKLPADPKVMYLKRVIGLPGERIQARGTRIYIDGQELPEARALVDFGDLQGELKEVSSEGAGPYRVYYDNRGDRDGELSGPGASMMKYGVIEEFKIPQGQYFLMGDSRDNSMDSRFWGTVPRKLILGKALAIVDPQGKRNDGRYFKPIE
jgi:signal peptidase I